MVGRGSLGVLVVCRLLLKTLRSLLMGRVCSSLIAGLQLLSRDHKAKKAEQLLYKTSVSVSLCTAHIMPRSRMHWASRQMADNGR